MIIQNYNINHNNFRQLDESVINSVHRRSLNLNSPERRKSKKQQMKDKGKKCDNMNRFSVLLHIFVYLNMHEPHSTVHTVYRLLQL